MCLNYVTGKVLTTITYPSLSLWIGVYSYQTSCFPCTYSQPAKLQVATLRSSLTYREMPLADLDALELSNFIYKYNRKNYHCHHSWHVDLNCRCTLSVLVLVFRTDPCNLLLPTKTYVPSSVLLMALTDTIRRSVLLIPLSKNFCNMVFLSFNFFFSNARTLCYYFI